MTSGHAGLPDAGAGPEPGDAERYISDNETVKRGMDFQLGIWTHAYVWEQQPTGELCH